MERQKWVEHVFNFGIDPGWAQNILSNVQDTEVRIQYHCQNLSDNALSQKPNGAWSIKEHIGHLIDLEDLHINRLNQFSLLKEELSAADMSNQKTEKSNHNNSAFSSLLKEFKIKRRQFISTFQSLNEMVLNHESFHPRLKVKMKPVDLLFFVVEHDNHHLTTIIEIKNRLK